MAASAVPASWADIANNQPPRRVHATPAESASPTLPASGDVAASIPAVTVIRLDAAGRPAAAWTSTGTRPNGADQFYVLVGGRTRRASAGERDRVISLAAGDWSTPGSWHRLDASE
jgi:hypothetical protein